MQPIIYCHFQFYDSIRLAEGLGFYSAQGYWLYCDSQVSFHLLGIPYPLFSHEQQHISCFVHGSKIVNYHNAVAEDIHFI